MKMDFDFMTKIYTGDAVIERGYSIYDEWKEKSLSSRKIVAEVERAVSAVGKNKAKAASAEALSYLFALDMRIKERYNGIIRCLLLYFSWRREAYALDLLRSTLRIPEDEKDIRTAIEVTLAKLREKIDTEEADGDDDETHGGKRNGRADDEDVVTEEKGQEQTAEEKTDEPEEVEETEESLEEGAEELAEETPVKEEAEKTDEGAETAQEEPEPKAQEEAEQELEEESPEIKFEEENNGAEYTEPSEDIEKTKEAGTYNDAVESPPLYEEPSRVTKTETTSFIDEVIMDNMVKGKEDIVGHNPLQDVKQSKEADRVTDTPVQRSENAKGNEKDAHLYDKMVLDEKGGGQNPTEKDGMQKPTEKTPEAKTEQKPETKTDHLEEQSQDDKKADSVKQEPENTRVPLKVDITNHQEVQAIRELNDTMSLESKLSYIRMQEDMLREQISISNKELGLDDNHGVLAIKEPDVASQYTAIQNKK